MGTLSERLYLRWFKTQIYAMDSEAVRDKKQSRVVLIRKRVFMIDPLKQLKGATGGIYYTPDKNIIRDKWISNCYIDNRNRIFYK